MVNDDIHAKTKITRKDNRAYQLILLDFIIIDAYYIIYDVQVTNEVNDEISISFLILHLCKLLIGFPF